MALLNFGKRYKDDLRVIFDQWPKLHFGLDELSNQKILKGVYSLRRLFTKKTMSIDNKTPNSLSLKVNNIF